MKSMWKKMASLLVVSGMTAAEAMAQTGGYGAPSLLPLPETAPQFSAAPSYAAPVQRTAYTAGTVARYQAPTDAPAEPVSPSDARPSVVSPSPYGHSGVMAPPSAPAPTSSYTVNGGATGSCGCNGGGCGNGGDYQAAMNNPWSGNCGPGGNSGYNGGRECNWYASVSGLVMTRDRGNRLWTSYETNRNDHQILNTESAKEGWTGGVETTVGKWIGCGCTDAVEVTYWGLYGMKGEASVRDDANNISTPFDTGFVTIGGAPASQFFDNAHEHLIRRSDEFHNVEVNWKHAVGCPCSSFELNWLSGFRYMNIQDQFHFFSVQGGHEFGDNGGINEACLHVETKNNLYGIQFGSEAIWHVTDCLSLKATPKVGLMGNHVTNSAYLKRGDDTYTFDYDSSKNDFSMFGQLDVAADYQIGCHWHLFGGYRVLGISRVALSPDQVPPFLNDADGFKEVRTNSDLILHGAFAGAEFRW